MKKIGNLKIHPSCEIKKSRVSIGFECMDRELIKWKSCVEPLAETGAKYARVQTGWVKCETTKGIYDFTWLDEIVDSLTSKGIIVWFCVGFGNPLYMENTPFPSAVGCSPTLYGKEAEEAWVNYVKALCEHYRGRVNLYEIWNESYNRQFWYPHDPDAKEFSELYNLTAHTIKSIIPDARIGCNVTCILESDSIEDNSVYEHTFFENIEPEDIDFSDYHAYGHVPELCVGEKIKSLRKWLNEKGFGHVEFWQGESGYPSWAPERHWVAKEGVPSERAQAVWHIRRFFSDFKTGTALTSVFQIADMWEKPYEQGRFVQEKCAAHGILHGLTYEKKEAFRTFSIMANLMSDDLELSDECFEVEAEGINEAANEFERRKCLKKWGNPLELRKLTDYIEKIAFTRNGYKMYEFHAILNVDGEYHLDAKVILPDTLKNPVLLDCYTGEVFEIEDFAHIDLTEYPKVICEREALEIV